LLRFGEVVSGAVASSRFGRWAIAAGHCNSISAGVGGSIPVALIANPLLEFSCAFTAAICPWPALKCDGKHLIRFGFQGDISGATSKNTNINSSWTILKNCNGRANPSLSASSSAPTNEIPRTDLLVQVDYVRVVDLDIGANKSDVCAIRVARRQNSSLQPGIIVEKL
jgi:hypothetical protein